MAKREVPPSMVTEAVQAGFKRQEVPGSTTDKLSMIEAAQQAHEEGTGTNVDSPKTAQNFASERGRLLLSVDAKFGGK